jgi:hypothetical protein
MLCPSAGGTPPPTSPVLPPCGTIGSFACAQIRTTRHRRGRSRAHHQPGGAAIEAARFDEIGFLVARVGDPAARTDHRFDLRERRLDLHDPSPIARFPALIVARTSAITYKG